MPILQALGFDNCVVAVVEPANKARAVDRGLWMHIKFEYIQYDVAYNKYIILIHNSYNDGGKFTMTCWPRDCKSM